MTDSNYTHILAIVDRSGSMTSIANDMIGGLNTYFSDQAKNDGKCRVDYVQFDDRYEVVFTDRDASEARAVLTPRGMTAMLDAIGKAVTDLGARLAKKPEDERPGLVQVVVVTDGLENASREWSAQAVKDLIKQQESDYSWDFVFLGANMDAVSVGQQFGFSGAKSMTYDIHNTGAMAASLSGYTTRNRVAYAAGPPAEATAFTDEDREANKA